MCVSTLTVIFSFTNIYEQNALFLIIYLGKLCNLKLWLNFIEYFLYLSHGNYVKNFNELISTKMENMLSTCVNNTANILSGIYKLHF